MLAHHPCCSLPGVQPNALLRSLSTYQGDGVSIAQKVHAQRRLSLSGEPWTLSYLLARTASLYPALPSQPAHESNVFHPVLQPCKKDCRGFLSAALTTFWHKIAYSLEVVDHLQKSVHALFTSPELYAQPGNQPTPFDSQATSASNSRAGSPRFMLILGLHHTATPSGTSLVHRLSLKHRW